MATITQTRKARPRPPRIDVNQYMTMISLGILPHETRVELLDGMLVEQMTRHAPHSFSVCQIRVLLAALLPEGWSLREEKPLQLGRFWRPEPDVAVIRGGYDLYRTRDPAAADVGLLVEVAESTYASDRGEKWRAYAAARIPAYWIVNLPGRRVEVYRDPAGRGKSAAYRDSATFGPEDDVPVTVEGRDVGRIAVRDLLP